ncbi:MAG: glycosyltransferase family 2 protein [Candidatus Peribacteraceae bacterium]|nr:glycosyltransferase family 2 protein [Candidatus Peribacteraceae bacterium]
MKNPLVSAIILSYGGNRARETVMCVSKLLDKDFLGGLEILVVDNHSGDDSIGLIRNQLSKYDVRIIEAPKHLGYGKGNNFGVKYATGKYILIINPDNILDSTGLLSLVRAMEDDESIGILAPKLVYEDGTVRSSFRKFPRLFDVFIKRTFLKFFFQKRLRLYVGEGGVPKEETESDWIAGACLLMRKDFYNYLGGFDPRFFLFFEDIDLCRRTWQAGKRVVFYPKVIAYDRKERLSEGGFITLFTKWTVRRHVISAIKYFWKWRKGNKTIKQ